MTELSGTDFAQLMAYKYGIPAPIVNYTIDIHHTSHYAAGHLFAAVQPRMAMVTHFVADEDIDAEWIAGIRAHYDGLFEFGVDVAVVNVTKDAVWYRKAVLPDKSGSVPPFREMIERAKRYGEKLPDTFVFPNPRMTREEQQDKRWRELEVDPHVYYPKEVYRQPLTAWPKDYTINVAAILGIKQEEKK